MSDIERTHTELLHWIGKDATEGTPTTLRAMLLKATEADIATVRETMRNADPDNRAAWIVGALKTAKAERYAVRDNATTKDDLLRLVGRIEQTVGQAQAQLADLRTLLAQAPITEKPARHRCTICDLKFRGPIALSDHLRNVHGVEAS